MLAMLLNTHDSGNLVKEGSVQRLGLGTYVFGTVKVHLRNVNGTLIGKAAHLYSLILTLLQQLVWEVDG
jgi:hypothetical protein